MGAAAEGGATGTLDVTPVPSVKEMRIPENAFTNGANSPPRMAFAMYWAVTTSFVVMKIVVFQKVNVA
jgi:hypothetical protein